VGALADDLAEAITQALKVRRADAANYGAQFSWERATGQFLNAIRQASSSAVFGMEYAPA